jgi:hypothetical protein
LCASFLKLTEIFDNIEKTGETPVIDYIKAFRNMQLNLILQST